MRFQIDIGADFYSGTVHTEDGPMQTVTEFFFIGCQAETGHRWTRSESFATRAEAEAALAAGVGTPDTDAEGWLSTYPCYGSDAWDEDAERDLACFEADAYGEPRPRW